MDKYILQYNARENAYRLYAENIYVLLPNDLNPFDAGYYERIVTSGVALLEEKVSQKKR